MPKIKVYCHTCHGTGTVTEQQYPSQKQVEVYCPECNGDKWVWVEATQNEL